MKEGDKEVLSAEKISGTGSGGSASSGSATKKKKQKSVRKKSIGGKGESKTSTTPEEPVHQDESGAEEATAGATVKKSGRYTLFVGNLPYGATVEQVKKFFKFRDILDVRLLTSKEGNAPKGCAFVEFSNAEGFRRGLEFHGKLIDGRRIRVQKTASGRGKSEVRLAKLKERNKKLGKIRNKKWREAKTKKQTAASVPASK